MCLRRLCSLWRTFFLLLLALPCTTLSAELPPFRIGMTPAFLHNQHSMLAEWKVYLERKLQRKVVFIQRDNYRETMDLIVKGNLDFAWICDYPYVALGKHVRLLATASYQNQPFYRSYLIVPAKDVETTSIADLKGKVFAYADPHSHTGYVVPRYEQRKAGVEADGHFKKTFFTWSHAKAIQAVASGLAQGANVDSYIWESLQRVDPELVGRTRIAWRSETYGFPPIVATQRVGAADFQLFQNALFGMGDDPAGRALLDKLNLDGFTPGSPALYEGVAAMMRELGDL